LLLTKSHINAILGASSAGARGGRNRQHSRN
jgi:hypothetical protein